MGFNCINENAVNLPEKIEQLLNDETIRIAMGKNARRCAAEKINRKNSYKELIDCILE